MTDTPPADTGIKLGDLKKLIQDTVSEVVKGVTPSPEKDPAKDSPTGGGGGGSVAERVRAEIERLKKEEKKETEDKTLRDQVKELAEARKEKPPVERRRVHGFMGWGENAD